MQSPLPKSPSIIVTPNECASSLLFITEDRIDQYCLYVHWNHLYIEETHISLTWQVQQQTICLTQDDNSLLFQHRPNAILESSLETSPRMDLDVLLQRVATSRYVHDGCAFLVSPCGGWVYGWRTLLTLIGSPRTSVMSWLLVCSRYKVFRMQIKLGNNVVLIPTTKTVIEIGSRSLWSLYSFCTYFTHVLRSY